MKRIAFVVAVALTACGDTAANSNSDSADASPPDSDVALDVEAGNDAPMEPAYTEAEVREWLRWAPPAAGTGAVEQYLDLSADTFWQAPWPSDLRASDRRPQIADFPNPDNNGFVARLVDIVAADVEGFGVSTALYLPLTGAIASEALPSVAASRNDGANVFVRNVDPNSPHYGELAPIEVFFVADAGRYGGTNQLVALPYAGAPLRANTRYAFVATTALRDTAGDRLLPSALVARMASVVPERLGEHPLRQYAEAVEALNALGVPEENIAALSVFSTGDPTSTLLALHDATSGQSPWVSLEPVRRTDQYDSYCVFERTGTLRNWQHGELPFESGGAWRLDSTGNPIEADPAPVRVWITAPRSAPPAEGFGVSLFARTGGGGDRPLIDRGIRDAEGNAVPGSGLANELARAGFVGVMVDGPHGGPRNPTRGDEQFLMFNIANPIAMRDNVRESAIELALVAAHLPELLDGVTACDGGDPLPVRSNRVALFGHSMGATIAPLVAAASPHVSTLLLSGAGGSWQQNILHKLLPIPTRPIAEFMLSYPSGFLSVTDPVLNLLQWAGEPADPQVYAHLVAVAPRDNHPRRHILMMQGIADTYILPPIANALSLPLGVQLLGDPLEAEEPESAAFASFVDAAEAIGRPQQPLPTGTRANLPENTSALLVQYREDGVEDGHEVVFQLPAAHEHVCAFLLTAQQGGAPGIDGGGACAR